MFFKYAFLLVAIVLSMLQVTLSAPQRVQIDRAAGPLPDGRGRYPDNRGYSVERAAGPLPDGRYNGGRIPNGTPVDVVPARDVGRRGFSVDPVYEYGKK
ncbi:unnamed protein product [Acanthoscelides obtectus]|uniref:Hymenoptaecin n=1 Tax=Acanthoscelides obtectus TaxID=200917 RepID=A0A9P0LAQ0_ACAOB|nr:unnamed protein product [Acanthoscelides obtectus]CAK1674271.1 hypothetical protein AOBTE_LOCUS29574 [Acanthoscelides obtectus]